MELVLPVVAICVLLIGMIVFSHLKSRRHREVTGHLERLVPMRRELNGHSPNREWEKAVESSLKASKERRG